MPRRIAVVPLTLRDLGMARSAIAVRLPDGLPATLTNQPASLYDEFRYGFEHARLRGRLSLLGVGRSITTGPDGSRPTRPGQPSFRGLIDRPEPRRRDRQNAALAFDQDVARI